MLTSTAGRAWAAARPARGHEGRRQRYGAGVCSISRPARGTRDMLELGSPSAGGPADRKDIESNRILGVSTAQSYTGVAALNPEVLHAQAEASVRALYQEGQSANTARSYATALRYWAAWFRLRYRAALEIPVPTPVVLQFIVDHVERTEAGARAREHDLPPAIDTALVTSGFKGTLGPPKLATVLHRLSVLSKAHTLREQANPLRDIRVQELLRRVRRAHAQRGELPKPKQALTKDPFEAMLATCTDGLIGLRDRALLLFAWASGGRRRSEVTGAVVEQLMAVDATTYLYRLVHSKTDQTGAVSQIEKPLVGVAAAALTEWLRASKITSGPIFRPKRWHLPGTIQQTRAREFAKALSRRTVTGVAHGGHRVQTAVRYFQTASVNRPGRAVE